MQARLVSRVDLTPEAMIIKVLPEHDALPEFIPGQYAELAVPKPGETKIIRRAYSIASAPDEKDGLEFYLVLVPGGDVTPNLFQLKPGDQLWLGPKIKGKFILDDVPSNKNLVMISTGTGIAPFVSMLRHYQGQNREQQNGEQQNRWQRFILIHGVRQEIDLGYRSELEHFSQENQNVHYLPTVSRAGQDSSWSGIRGRVQVVLEEGHYQSIVGVPLDPATTHVFLCGNPEMIDSMEVLLGQKGFQTHSKKNPGNIHLERYW